MLSRLLLTLGMLTLPAAPLWMSAQEPARVKYLAGFDREEARRLLAEAGYPKGFTTPLWHHPGYTTPWPSRVMITTSSVK